MTKSDFEVVIARYDEEIKFISEDRLLNTTVYNKGENDVPDRFECVRTLPNVGHEAHTYLTHILENYNDLAEVTMFSQGAIRGHNVFGDLSKYEVPGLNIRLDQRKTRCHSMWGRMQHSGKWRRELNNGSMRPAKYKFGEFWDKYILRRRPNRDHDFRWSHGAIFSVARDIIHSSDKSYYERLLSLISDHRNPEEGHYFERSWNYIFSTDCRFLSNR